MVVNPRYFRLSRGEHIPSVRGRWGLFDSAGYHNTQVNIKIDSRLSILYIITRSRANKPWTRLEWKELQVELERYSIK